MALFFPVFLVSKSDTHIANEPAACVRGVASAWFEAMPRSANLTRSELSATARDLCAWCSSCWEPSDYWRRAPSGGWQQEPNGQRLIPRGVHPTAVQTAR